MHPKRKQRLIIISLVMTGLMLATGLILYALSQNINLYLTPSEITSQHLKQKNIRLGGMVQKGTIHHANKTLMVDFMVTDYTKQVKVQFSGVLPALFREGQGVVVEGRLDGSGAFQATRVLAKHDEKYMPPKIKAKYDT